MSSAARSSISIAALVKLVAGAGRSPTQLHPVAQSCQGAPAGTIIDLALAHDLLQPRRQHGADGSALFGGEDTDLAEESGIKFQGDISFHGSTYLRAAQVHVLQIPTSINPDAWICRSKSQNRTSRGKLRALIPIILHCLGIGDPHNLFRLERSPVQLFKPLQQVTATPLASITMLTVWTVDSQAG